MLNSKNLTVFKLIRLFLKVIRQLLLKLYDIYCTNMKYPSLISKSTNSILMTLCPTLYKNCSYYRSAICFKIGLGLAEIIRCLCTKVVFL